MHLVGNFFTTFIFVSRVEYTFGPLRTLIIYLLSGIGGNIFSDLVNPSNMIVKAGASTSLFGIIGTILGYLILNWKGLDVIGKMLKCQLIFLSLIIILFILILTPFNQNIDTYGHIGGFIIGLFICAIQPTIRN
jgi:rhomboid protease GluP